MATSVLKTAFFIPISADEKGASGFRVLANHLASFFFLHPVRWFIWTTIRTSLSPSLSTRVRLRSTDSLTYILIFSFNGQPLGPVNSNTEGVGEISYFSPLSGRPRDTCLLTSTTFCYTSLHIYIYSWDKLKPQQHDCIIIHTHTNNHTYNHIQRTCKYNLNI